MSDRAQAYYDDDGAIAIRASAIGKCSRSLWASLEDIEPIVPSDRIESIFSEGHLHEQAVRELLESEGAEIEDQEQVTLWIIPGKLKITGHVDGNITNWNQVWECKALGKEGFKRWRNVGFDAYPEYPWQISVYMLALDKPALYTVKCRDDGQLDRMVIQEPPIPIKEIRAKAIGVYTAHKNGVMPECDPERWMCSFYFLHDEAKENETFELDDPYYESAASRLADVREQIKFLQGVEKELKEDLNSLAQGTHVAGMYEIDVTEVSQMRLDQKKMVESGLNPDDYKVERSYRTVKVRERRG